MFEAVHILQNYVSRGDSVAISGDGLTLASGCDDNTIKMSFPDNIILGRETALPCPPLRGGLLGNFEKNFAWGVALMTICLLYLFLLLV